MADKLETYRGKRDAQAYPRAGPAEGPAAAGRRRHLRHPGAPRPSLHWDLRLERDGVLVSWAIPKGLPRRPRRPTTWPCTPRTTRMEYAGSHGEIPQGEYGGGTMTIWDRGTYATEKWSDREVKIVLNGARVARPLRAVPDRGQELDDPPHGPPAAGRPAARDAAPMRPTDAPACPATRTAYAYEFAWGGRRLLAYVERGPPATRRRGRHRRAPLAAPAGRVVRQQDRRAGRRGRHRRGRGASGLLRPAVRRRPVVGGPSRTAPPRRPGGLACRRAALADGARPGPARPTRCAGRPREQGLPGIVAKRLDSPYEPGESTAWLFLPS